MILLFQLSKLKLYKYGIRDQKPACLREFGVAIGALEEKLAALGAQVQMLFDRLEVFVAVQQAKAIRQAAGRYQHIHPSCP
jgi:hypothetical protein